MSVTEFPTRFAPKAKPVEVVEELLKKEEALDNTAPLGIFEQNKVTIEKVLLLLAKLREEGTMDMNSEALLRGVLQIIVHQYKLNVNHAWEHGTNNEPERA